MDEEFILNVQGGARIAVPAALDCLSTYILLEQEDWFEDEIRFVRRWLRPGMQAVDVGANVGVYTNAMAQAVGSSGQVWAFEPTPAAAHFLERSIGINGYKNVVVSRAAVSEREGTIAFSVGAHSELNAVAKPGGALGDVVQVRAATLDRMAADYGWTNVDLVKLDVEGHEFEVIAGGKKFLHENSPLLMFEIKADNGVDLRALKPLAELGYEFYRLLPGPLFLVPFDPSSTDPSDLLNAFACKPDRAERIAAAGMLVRAAASRVAIGRTELAGGDAAATYLEGLAAYAHSREETRGSSERYAWLSHSFRCVAHALEARPSVPKRISYSRIAGELAMRVASIKALAAIDRLATDWQAALAEPCLAPAERQESMRPGGDGLEWLNCCVVEQWEKIRTYSSVFAGTTSLQVIAPIRGLSGSAEMERRWQLVRMRHGMQAGPEPAAVLRKRTSQNLNPEFWCGSDSSYWFETGLGCLDRGRAIEAESAFRNALALDPKHAKANVNLGMLLQRTGKDAKAEQHYRQALQADAGLAQGWFNLGTLLLDRGEIAGAADCFRSAVALDANRALWHSALGSALRQSGDAESALASFRRAHELEPDNQAFASDMLHALNFASGVSAAEILEQHIAWARRRAVPERNAPHENLLDPAKKLRIGYLAPDFSDPELACLIEPALEHGSRESFEMLCYSDAEAESGDVWRLRKLADLWHATARMGTEQLSARIEEDRVDILVDLAGHGARGKRIPVFEQRPAPLQFTWAADPCISGLVSIDWLTDLRQGLRARVERSPLTDAKHFVAQLERLYRDAWQEHCRANAPRTASARHASAMAPAGSPPRVVVDGVFFQDYATGIARVWRSLFHEWGRSGFAKNVLLLDRDGTAPPIPGMRMRTVPRHSYDALDADRAMLQAVCDEERATVFTSTYYSTPTATPVVMMVYDMIPEVLNADLSVPDWREKAHCIGRASRFVAISHSTARDLRSFHPAVPAGGITVAHVGVDPVFRPAGSAEMEDFRRRHGIASPYFLLVGSRPSYKNAGTFFRAFASLPDRARYSVLCVGNMPDLDPAQAAACAGSLIKLVSLSDEDLRLAYCGALALMYPSTYEGFGMPVIEALASGCPVITTSHASLPEAAGGAAVYVDPFDHVGLARAMVEIQNPDLRAALLPKGLAHARNFSWTEMARSVAAVLGGFT